MSLNGKKTERVLMRVSEDMAREVRALAELECRTIQDQFRALLISALNQRKAEAGNGSVAGMRQPLSTRTFAEEQAKAVPSTAVLPGQLLLPNTAGPIPAKRRKVG